MGVLSVAEVDGGCGVEFAGGEDFVHAHPLVFVVRDLTVPRARGHDGYARPRAQVSTVRRAGDSVVARLVPGEIPVGRRHRSHQGTFHGGLGRGTLLDHLQISIEVRVFGLEPGEAFFEAPDEFLVRLARDGADIQRDVGARGDDVDLGLPAIRAHQYRRREARITEERVLTAASYLLSLQLLDRDHEPCRPGDGVDAASGHGPVRHLAPHRDLDPQSALLLDAELVLLRLADDGAVHPFRVTPLDEAFDPGHHPLLVHRMAENDPAGKRHSRVLDRTHRHDRRSQVPLRVARAPPVDEIPYPLCLERRMPPVLRPPLGHHVGVRLEEQGLPRPLALPHRPDVRTSRRGLLNVNLEALAREAVSYEARDAIFVAIGFLGTVDARDADELPGEARQLLAVDSVPHRCQKFLELGAGSLPRARLRHRLPDVALRRIVFQAPLHCVQEAQGDATIQDAVVEGDLQVHHAPDGDGVVHDDRSFHNGFGREYRRLRVVDDRDGDHGAKSARVVHRERPSRDVVGRELSVPRLPDDLVYLAGEAQSIQLVGVADDGYDQGSLLQVHRDADVDLLAQHDPVPVPHGVEDRMLLEALDHRLDDERQVGESHAFAFDELLLDTLAQRDEPAHVRLDHAPGVGRLALALGHAVRYGPPDARELHDPVAVVDFHPFPLGLRRGVLFPARCGLAFFDVALDVLLGHPAAGAGAGDLGYVHVVLRSKPPHHRRGTLQAQRLCALYGSASVAATATRLGDRALLLAVLGGGLGLGVRRRKLLGRRLGSHVLAGLGLRGRRLLPIDGDERDLGPHVHRGPLRDQ